MAHPLDRDIATDRSYDVLQVRRLRGEDGPCALDSTHRHLYPLPSVSVQREAFISDREVAVDSCLPWATVTRRRER